MEEKEKEREEEEEDEGEELFIQSVERLDPARQR